MRHASAGIVFVAACVAFAGWAAAAERLVRVDCAALKLPTNTKIREATHPRITSVAKRVFDIAQVDVRVRVCEYASKDAPLTAISAKVLDTDGEVMRGYLIISRGAAERFSEDGFVGLVAHETAHMTVATEGACDAGNYVKRLPPVHERVACEAPLDAKAAQWVGAPAVIAFLREQNNALRGKVNADIQAYMDAEVASRIKLLEQ